MIRENLSQTEVGLLDGKTGVEFGIGKEPRDLRRTDKRTVVYREELIRNMRHKSGQIGTDIGDAYVKIFRFDFSADTAVKRSCFRNLQIDIAFIGDNSRNAE